MNMISILLFLGAISLFVGVMNYLGREKSLFGNRIRRMIRYLREDYF